MMQIEEFPACIEPEAHSGDYQTSDLEKPSVSYNFSQLALANSGL